MLDRAFPALAVLVLVAASACQPGAAPAAAPEPTADPTTRPALATVVRPATPTTAAAPATAAQATTAPASAAPAVPASATQQPQSARPAPTALPVLPVSSLGTLPADQRTAVRAGQSALAAGDYARALTLLDPLLTETSADPQAEVRLLAAQALVGDRQFESALDASDTLIGATSRADLLSAAHLARGLALRGLGRFDDAAAELRAVADANPLVSSAVRLELEDMWLLEANRPDQAALDGRQGLDVAQPRLLKIELAENLGKAEVALGNTDAAMDAYRQLLTAAGTAGFLGEQLYNLAEGAAALGRTDDAINALRTSIDQFPRSRKAPEAVDLLEKLGGMRPQDRFASGLIRYYFWNFRGARADFDAYLDALPDGDRAIDARYYRGLSSPAQETSRQLLVLADDEPNDDFAPMALLEAGKAQEELGDYTTAEHIYDRLVATYATRDAGLSGEFRRGLARYMQNNLGGALQSWDELLRRDTDAAVRAQALYWSGKALSESGDEAGARDRYGAAAAVRPLSYYVLRAQVALDPPPPSSGFDPASVTPADKRALAEWFGKNGLDLQSAEQTASQDPAYLRTVALVQHGLYRAANWEHEVFLTTYVDKPDRLYWLATRFDDLGLPNAALKLGTAAVSAATAEGQISVLDIPPALARVASPLAYPDLVTSTARARGLDPLLLMSLMHQESDFDAYAESVAKAKGLTQIIPQTGLEIANKLAVRNFRQEDLFHPKQNLQFGAWYFSQRLQRNTQVARALASYNAGDGNVDTWTLPGRDDPDVFSEYVPFAETHDYVKKIEAFWWLNRYLWQR